VPRNNSESAEDAGDYQEDTPTFCSPSLQVSCNSEELSSDAPNITNNPIKTTYASVMRRFNKKDVLEGEEGPSSGPTSLAGLVKSQSNKKKGKGPWRPLQLSDFGEDEYNNDGEGSDQERMTSFTEDFSNQFDLDRHSQNNGT
jgi:hypothetical protein